MTRARSLVALQESLLDAMSSTSGLVPAPAFMPFEAAGRTWYLRSAEVLYLAIPGDITSLQGYAGTPRCIQGVLPTDAEMLSVVDAGLLLGNASIVKSLKSRLIVFGTGPLRGVALMVDRVLDRVDAIDSSAASVLDAGELHSKLSRLAAASEV